MNIERILTTQKPTPKAISLDHHAICAPPNLMLKRYGDKATAQLGRADRHRGLDDRRHVLVLAATASVNFYRHIAPHVPYHRVT
jgi:hypothetical protein